MPKIINKNFALHPFLVAVYPVLFLLSNNIEQLDVQQGVRPLIIIIVIAFLLVMVFGWVTRDFLRAGITASLIIALFFSYGHVHRIFEEKVPWMSSHLLLSVIWLTLLILGMKLKWKIKNIEKTTQMLNLMAVILLIFPLSTLFLSLNRSPELVIVDNPNQKEKNYSVDIINNNLNGNQPNIYYIIVDGYGRSDILQEIFNYNNFEFLKFLEVQGFFVADESRSNYISTRESLASSLNFQYINYVGEKNQSTSHNYDKLAEMIQHSQVRRFFENRGYQTITYQTGSGFTTITDSDLFVSYRPTFISELEYLILASSATRIIGDRLANIFNPYTCKGHHANILSIFDHINQIPGMVGSYFVFAHIMSPHPPFVFTEDGRLSRGGDCDGWDGNYFGGSPEEYKRSYEQQIKYITVLLQETITRILSSSDIQPIIILQSDHGPGLLTNFRTSSETCLKERTSIINAYYFPDKDYGYLYESITPVNTFRVILNQYFNQDLSLLEDKIFFMPNEDVTDRIEEQCIIKN